MLLICLKFTKFQVEHQLDQKIKLVRLNLGGEYCRKYDEIGRQQIGPFARYLQECGTVCFGTIPRPLEQNGLAEKTKPNSNGYGNK